LKLKQDSWSDVYKNYDKLLLSLSTIILLEKYWKFFWENFPAPHHYTVQLCINVKLFADIDTVSLKKQNKSSHIFNTAPMRQEHC